MRIDNIRIKKRKTMTNLPKEWQERAESYSNQWKTQSSSEGLENIADDFLNGASEMRDAILKVIEDYQKIYESELSDYGLEKNESIKEEGKTIYIAKLNGLLLLKEEIQNVKP